MLADIVNKQCSNRTSIICRCDGAVAFLAGGIPDLGFNSLGIDLDGAGGKFDADSRFGVKVEFITGKSAEQVGFPNAGVSDQNHYSRGKIVSECG